jgi:hypothetical protein
MISFQLKWPYAPVGADAEAYFPFLKILFFSKCEKYTFVQNKQAHTYMPK